MEGVRAKTILVVIPLTHTPNTLLSGRKDVVNQCLEFDLSPYLLGSCEGVSCESWPPPPWWSCLRTER